jgi:hypothetical protein
MNERDMKDMLIEKQKDRIARLEKENDNLRENITQLARKRGAK